MSVVFDILILNTAGTRDSNNRRKLFNYAKKHTSSGGIVFLQKTHSSEKKRKIMGNSVGLWKRGSYFFHMAHQMLGGGS